MISGRKGAGEPVVEQRDHHLMTDIARLLSRLSDAGVVLDNGCGFPDRPAISGRILGEVRQEQSRRTRRAALLAPGTDIFAEPAWDILLELFVAQLSGQKLNASVVGCEAGIAQSTALRWLALLEKQGLTKRTRDIADKRRLWVALTPATFAALEQYFG